MQAISNSIENMGPDYGPGDTVILQDARQGVVIDLQPDFSPFHWAVRVRVGRRVENHISSSVTRVPAHASR